MNNQNNDFIGSFIKAALLANLQMQNTDPRKLGPWMFAGNEAHRRYLEHHANIQTEITDRDMLLLQIDMALDSGDGEMFMLLTNELKGMEVPV